MALFVVQHLHQSENCPAGKPEMAAALLKHISQANAASQGITIQSEAVVNGMHVLYMIVEAADRQTIDRFMQPFAMVGSVEILPASTCESVVARGVC